MHKDGRRQSACRERCVRQRHPPVARGGVRRNWESVWGRGVRHAWQNASPWVSSSDPCLPAVLTARAAYP
jgi:hypothetical protein